MRRRAVKKWETKDIFLKGIRLLSPAPPTILYILCPSVRILAVAMPFFHRVVR